MADDLDFDLFVGFVDFVLVCSFLYYQNLNSKSPVCGRK